MSWYHNHKKVSKTARKLKKNDVIITKKLAETQKKLFLRSKDCNLNAKVVSQALSPNSSLLEFRDNLI